jgi:hypothetical protein
LSGIADCVNCSFRPDQENRNAGICFLRFGIIESAPKPDIPLKFEVAQAHRL